MFFFHASAISLNPIFFYVDRISNISFCRVTFLWSIDWEAQAKSKIVKYQFDQISLVYSENKTTWKNLDHCINLLKDRFLNQTISLGQRSAPESPTLAILSVRRHWFCIALLAGSIQTSLRRNGHRSWS